MGMSKGNGYIEKKGALETGSEVSLEELPLSIA